MISVEPVSADTRKALAKIRNTSEPSTVSRKWIDHEIASTLTIRAVPPLEDVHPWLKTYRLVWPAAQTDVVEPMPRRGPANSARQLWIFSLSWSAHNQIGLPQ